MTRPGILWTAIVASILCTAALDCHSDTSGENTIPLPAPGRQGKTSVEACIASRRTIRSFASMPLDIDTISQLLWACQGVTGEGDWQRAAPSGGGLHPIDLYLVLGAGGAKGIGAGVYHYLPRDHSIEFIASGDRRARLAKASLGQTWIAGAPAIVVITSEYRRITVKYGDRGVRYALMEAGCVAENLFLQAEGMGLGAGIVGAFDEAEVALTISSRPGHEPLLIMPVGYKE